MEIYGAINLAMDLAITLARGIYGAIFFAKTIATEITIWVPAELKMAVKQANASKNDAKAAKEKWVHDKLERVVK